MLPWFTSKWNPRKIPGCFLWLEPSRGVTLDGSNNVSAWADQSGNNNNVTQTDPTHRPAYIASGLSGRPILRYSSSQWLSATTPYLTGPHTIIAVCKHTGASGSIGSLIVLPDASDLTTCSEILLANAFSGYLNITFYSRSTGSPAKGVNSDLLNGSWGILTQTADNTPTYGAFLNGNSALIANSGAAAVALSSRVLSVGGRIDNTVGLSADVAAFTVYNHILTTTERQRIEHFYGQKYGIAVA